MPPPPAAASGKKAHPKQSSPKSNKNDTKPASKTDVIPEETATAPKVAASPKAPKAANVETSKEVPTPTTRKMADVLDAASKEPLYKQQQKLHDRCKDYPMGTPQQMLNPGLIGASIMGSKGMLHILSGAEVENAKVHFSPETRASLEELGPQKSIYLLSLFKQYESMRVSTSLKMAMSEDKLGGGTLTEEEVRTKLSKQCATDFSAKINRELDLTKQLHDRFSKVDAENRKIRLISMFLVLTIVVSTVGFIVWVTAEPDRTRQVVMLTNYYLHRLSAKFGSKGDVAGSGLPSYPDPKGFQRPTDDTPAVAMHGGQPFGIYDGQ